jgi:hypothetical protein
LVEHTKTVKIPHIIPTFTITRPSKVFQIGIFGMKINQLATLDFAIYKYRGLEII